MKTDETEKKYNHAQLRDAVSLLHQSATVPNPRHYLNTAAAILGLSAGDLSDEALRELLARELGIRS